MKEQHQTRQSKKMESSSRRHNTFTSQINVPNVAEYCTDLPDNLKAGVESLSGIDMSHVRVYYNSSKPAEIGALAYAQGKDIYISPGQEKYLPHEAWHVVQQMQGRVKTTLYLKGLAINTNDILEAEANAMGEKASQMKINRNIEHSLRKKSLTFFQCIEHTGSDENSHTSTDNIIQRVVATNYVVEGRNTVYASATITLADLNTGTPITVSGEDIPSHMGNAHPYHHERAHLIGRQLGGDGADPRNFVGLSDGTNAPLMVDIESHVRDILTAAASGASIFLEVTVDYSDTNYNGTPFAPFVPGMVGSISVTVSDRAGGTVLYSQIYPNGVVKNHNCC